ncbi:restriction endonuclease [Halorubrum vacuolatum]|uniref:Restriction endonuclease n=1 Tax=Halorubrum vacuolatum TaxID=63740 RepID=A0A238XB88_HALVU|nr:restriction endonuclease [Halorubrum vacuolatum]SNR56227.1 Restriction endonuclease [Halorubrum vacuolatum]
MKRFLRYVLYRELYRWIRNAGKDASKDDEGASGRRSATQRRSAQRTVDDLPIEEGPLDGPDDLKAVLQRMDPYEFEHFIGALWDRMGWETSVSTESMDEGVDVTARKESPYPQTLLIQAKRYGPNTTVGSPDVQQYASLRHQYAGVDKVLIVTTNEFTGQAKDLADRLNVKLIDGDDLARLIIEREALDLVADFLDFVEIIEERDQESDHDAPPDVTGEAATPTSGGTEEARTPKAGEEPAGGTEANESMTDRSVTLPSTVSVKVIMAAIPGWLVAFFGVNAIPETIWGLLFFGVWLGLPLAIFLDARRVRDHVEWPARTWVYVLTSFVWLLAVVPAALYLWRRRSIERGPSGGSDSNTTSA